MSRRRYLGPDELILLVILMIPVGLIVGIRSIFRLIIRAIFIFKFKRKITPIINLVNKQLERLDDIFVPNRNVSDEEIELFFLENEVVKDSVLKIDTQKRSYLKEYLDSIIKPYVEKTARNTLLKRQKENNIIADAIVELNSYSSKVLECYETLKSESHYFTYSEMEHFKKRFDRVEILSNIVAPNYEKYLGNEEKRMLNVYNNIELERKTHNEEFINKELINNKDYFDTVLGTYPLDQQQRESIVKLEDNCLVIASAGSGKTSTIIGKVKYLVEKQNIDPSKILLITYTRKAAHELHLRMNIEGVVCSTFHALAYNIISEVTKQAPSICDSNVTLNVFYKLIENDKGFLHAINNYILNQQSIMGLEHDYNNAFSYFEDRKKYGIQALFRDVDGKMIFTRSEEEKRLISILTRLGILFRYETPYQYNTTTPEKRQYRPDFTIYYQNNQRQWLWLYLEHFAIDSLGNVPRWFGEGTKGGWKDANQKYKEGIAWKRNTHRQNGTILIETTSADFKEGKVEEKLRQQLVKYGVPIKERTDKEIYELLVTRNRKIEKSVYMLIISFITLMKANEKTIEGLLMELEAKTAGNRDTNINPNNIRNREVLNNIIVPFYDEYERTLSLRNEIDFTDAIIQATDICNKGLWKSYDYILVDEFQDISIDRYKLLQALRINNSQTKLFCVGDDWQSIYRFAGSDMSLVYEFEKYFGYTEHCKIETTYRFHQPLIDKSSNFVMKNKEQKEKTIKTPNGDSYKTHLNFVKCDDEGKKILNEVERIVSSIPENQSILLLGRYNYDAISLDYKGDFSDNRMTVRVGTRKIPFLSVHSAKGLEADNVILVNCNQGVYGFPSLIEDDPILDFVLSKKEVYPFAEERRLFYVAMTRAKQNMYVLYDQKRPSPFVGEFVLKIEKGSYLCPICLDGKMVAKEDFISNGGKYHSFVCTNKESGCNFFETKFNDSTPPGILITEDMTMQDIEELKKVRRNNGRIVFPQNLQSSIVEESEEESDYELPF